MSIKSESVGLLHTHLPWNFITKFHEGVVVQKDGILQRTFAYRAPDTGSQDAAGINALSLRINDFAKRLGDGWAFFIEAQRFSLREYPAANFSSAPFDALAPYLIDRERMGAFRKAGAHFDSSYFLTLVYKPPAESVKAIARFFINSNVSKQEGGKNLRENVEFFTRESDSFIAVLSNDILFSPLNNEQTASYLHSSISLNRHHIHFPYTSILLDRILPDSPLLTDLTMKLGDYFIPIIGVNDFPDETYPAILENLNRSPLEYRWMTRFICQGKEEAVKEAQKKEKAHRGSRKTFFQTFIESTSGEEAKSVNHGAGVRESDAINAGVEIETDEASLGFLTTCVMVFDKDAGIAKKKAAFVKNIINQAGFTCKEETFNALEAWKSMMPGQVYANYRSYAVMSYTLSHLIPLSSVWPGQRTCEHAGAVSGVNLPHLVCSTEEGTPFFLNLAVGDVGHTAIWGPTGAGKSTFLNLLETQFLKYPGSRVIVFDKGKSSRQICLASGGLFYEPACENAAGVSFQPLSSLESENDLDGAMDFIESLFTVNGFDTPPPMRAAIKESLELLREKPASTRTITSFLHYVNYLDPETKRPVMQEMLSDYLWSGGKYGKVFDARVSDFNTNTRFLAFEMEALMNRGDGAIVPALVYLFNLVEKLFDGRLTLLVLDEAWLFLKHETFADKIAEWLKVLRKKNVYVIFATQDVADAERSTLKTTIIQQCLTKIYLADPSALTPGMINVYRAFGLSDSEIALIAGATMKRDYFYTSPLGRRLFQLNLGPLSLALVGSPKHELLNSLAGQQADGLCESLLEKLDVPFSHLLGEDAPKRGPLPEAGKTVCLPPLQEKEEQSTPAQHTENPFAAFMAACKNLKRNKKGQGRAIEDLARRFGLSKNTAYRLKAVSEEDDLQKQVEIGALSVYKAYRLLKKNRRVENQTLKEASSE